MNFNSNFTFPSVSPNQGTWLISPEPRALVEKYCSSEVQASNC